MEKHYFIFSYISQLDCFTVNLTYKKIAQQLGLTEWNEVVWIGRFFSLDNDYGEHWMDNWEQRDLMEEKAKNMGLAYDDLLIIDPERMKNNENGPVHSPEQRKLFWTDVLKSLKISQKMLIEEARRINTLRDKNAPNFIQNLEAVIQSLRG